MGLQKIGKKIKNQTAQAVQKAQSAAKPSQTPKRTGATAVAKKTGQAAGQKVQYYSNKNKGGARRAGTAVKNKVGAKVKANKNTPSPYQRQKTAQANVKMRQLNIPTMTKDYFKNPQKNPLDRRDLLSQIGGALQAAQNPADRFHGLKERSVTRSPMEQLRADAIAGRGAWASDLRVETKKSDKEKAKEIVENSKKAMRNRKVARQDLSEWDRRNMNAAQQRQVQEAKLRYKEAQKAGKKEDAARAHREAENLRGLHGYSGGAAGDQFIRPELSQGEYNALNSQGELAMRQARMARQRAVTEDEIARADQRIEAILRAPGYREGPVTDADTSRGWSFGPEGRRMWAGTRGQNRQDAQQSKAALQATGEGIVGGLAYAGQIANRANRDRYEAANMDQWIADADDYISAQSDLEYYDNFVRQFGRAPDDMPNRNVLVMRLNRAIQARAQLERVQGDVDSLYFDPTMAKVLGLPTTRDETFGERMLRQAAEHQAEATEGMTGAERFLTDAMISTGQSLPGMALGTIPGIGPALGLGVLGAQAAGSRAYELTQQGLTAGEALRGGLISGGIEILTEKLPLEHFAKIVSGKSGRSAIKNILRQAGLEGTEEAVSYVGNYVADVAQNNPDAQFSWAELLENAGMGAVSGGIFGVGGSLIGEGRGRAAMPQIGDIQARTQEQAEAITQVQDLVSDERTQEARSLLEDTKAYNEMKQTGLYSQDELGMMRDALNERYARLAGVEEVPQTVTEPAPRTLEEAAQQRTMNVQPELPPVQWERSKFPPSSLVGSLIDAARENNARNRAAEQLRADQAAFRAQQAQREAQAAEPKAQPVQTQTAERQAQPVGQARSMVQQSPQVQRDILARNVSAFGENGRKAIMEAYQGGDAGAYRQAFAQVYDQAVSGKTQEQITRPSALTEPQFYAAVQSGMNDRAAARPAGRVAGRNKNDGVDWRDQYVRQMDRRTAKMVDGVARALGVRVIFADEGSILTGTGAQANAEIVGNVVRIEKNNPNPVRKLIGHELTHRMQDLSPETYQTFRDYVMSIPGAQNALEQTLALYESGTGGFTREAAMDELAADFAGELWDSSEKLQDFIRKNYTNRTLLERVRDAFRALAAKLTGREKVQADEAVRLLEDALGAASEAVETMETEQNTAKAMGVDNVVLANGARFSISARTDADYMAAVETGDMETAQRMVDEAAKAAGYTIKAYHGTPNGTFHVFRDWSYFTEDRDYADVYQNQGASSNGYKQTADNPKTYGVYLEPKNAFDTRIARDRKIFQNEFYRQWGNGAPLSERGLPDWTDGDDLIEFFDEKGYDYDAFYLDEGGTGGYGDEVHDRGVSIVIKDSAQVKSADPVTYDDDGNVIPLSERFQDDNPDIRFSLKGTGGMDNARLLRENQKLRDRVEYWKGQTKKSDRAKVEPKEVKKLARRLATDFSSAMDRTEIAGELQAIYDGLGKDWTYDQAYEAAHALAMNMVEQASESDGFLYNEYEPMRVFFRETPLVISPEIKRGITDYNDWRKAQMGRLRLQSGEQSNIDQVYQEVSQLWPEWFDEEREATSLDQLERIVEVMDGIYTQEENNPFQDDLEGPAGYLAAEIMDSFWDLPNVKKTWADRAEARLGREVTRRLDMQEKYQEKLRQVREDRDRKLKEQSAAYLGRTKARSQRQKERERRAQIMRHARDLSKKLLKPSDKQHIPQQLREAVAAVLDSVNLASKNFKETNRTKAFQELRLAYQDILQQGESLVIDPDLMDNIREVEAMRDTPIAEMDLSQLETIWRTIRAVEASITTANKAFGRQRFATIFEAADGLRQGLGSRKDRGEYRGPVGAFDKLLNSGMLTPESYFHRMGQTGQDIFRMLRNAQDRHIGIMQEAQDYTEKVVGKTKVRKWEKEVHTFDFDGENVQLTTAQIMSLYELMKRQQAVDHIVVGGIKPEGVDRGVKKKAPSEPYRLTIDQISEIVDSLTEEQMAMADALQKYMGGRLAQLGNEASMAVYGYEKFNEKNYFPIKVDKNQTITDQTKEAQAATIAGRGFTKGTTPKANNALIVRNIFDVYADHVTDMATYSSWLEAMENLQRIYNFTFRDADGNRTGTVKANLERTFGRNGLSYWEKLTEDLNNGVHGTNDNPFNSLIGNYKASAIGANIRVFIQQPTAILRALDDINPVDFLAGLGRTRPTTWAKVKKYAPIAVWKDWGYFDADTGRQMKSILFGDDSALAKVNNGLMAPAGAMDSLAWSHIWNALEAETRRTRKDLKPRTDEFYQAVAARFNAVIDHSQVVDGILQRSQVMRSPDALTKMATSFMAEPTKVYNMFTTAVYDLKHSQDPKARTQAMKVMGRTTFALIASFFANAAAQSLVDALRDDDKGEDYWEKFFQAFYGLEGDEETTGAKIKNGLLEGNLGAAFNPATYIPWMKDVVSLAQGFKVSRMDMDSISKFVQEIGSTWKAFHGDGKITLRNALARLTAEGARLLGVPAANIKRDVLAIYSTVMNSQNNYLGQFALQKWLYRLDNSNNWTDFVKIAYAAQQAGDTTAYEKIRAELVDAMGQEKYDEKMKNLTKKDMEAGGDLENRVADTYGAYETMMAGNPGYQSLTAEQQAKVQDSLTGYAQMQVAEEASGGELVSNDNEMAAIRAAEQAGIDPVTWKSFKVFCADTSADKKEDGTSIRGSKKAKVEAWLDENEITGSAREYCMEHYN